MFPSNLEKEFEENSVTLHGRLSPWGPAYHTRSSLDPAQKKEEKNSLSCASVSIALIGSRLGNSIQFLIDNIILRFGAPAAPALMFFAPHRLNTTSPTLKPARGGCCLRW